MFKIVVKSTLFMFWITNWVGLGLGRNSHNMTNQDLNPDRKSYSRLILTWRVSYKITYGESNPWKPKKYIIGLDRLDMLNIYTKIHFLRPGICLFQHQRIAFGLLVFCFVSKLLASIYVYIYASEKL